MPSIFDEVEKSFADAKPSVFDEVEAQLKAAPTEPVRPDEEVLKEPSTWQAFRMGPVGRKVLGPTEIEREAMAGQPAGVAGLFEPALKIPSLPKPSETPTTKLETFATQATPLPLAIKAAFGQDVATAFMRESYNVAKGLAEFPTSLGGAVSLMAGAAYPVATAAVFEADLLKNMVKEIPELWNNWDKMSPEDKAQGLARVFGTAGMMGGIAHGGLTVRGVQEKLATEKTEAARLSPTELGWRRLKENISNLVGRPTGLPEVPREPLPLPMLPPVPPATKQKEELVSEPKPSPVAQEKAAEVPPPEGAVGELAKAAPVVAPTEAAAPAISEVKPETKEVQAPTIQGMGGAVPSEYGAGSPTSLKNAVVDKERVARGEQPMMAPLRRTWGEVWDQAMAEIERHAWRQDLLIDELIRQPRPISDVENAMLLHRRVDLRNEYAKATRDAAQAYEDSKVYPERLAEFRTAQALVKKWSDELLKLEQATGKGGAGTETGRALAARKMMADEDFTLASLETQKRADVGFRELTSDERAKLEKIAADYKATADALQKRVAELEAKQAPQQAEQIIQKVRAQVAREPKPPGEVPEPDLNMFSADVVNRIKKKREQTPGYDISYYANRLAMMFVRQGIREREALIDSVHGVLRQAIPELTRRETMDAISGYGDYTPLSKEANKVILRDLKGQMQQIGKLEDMASGVAPSKTGYGRAIPSDEQRRLIKQVEEAKRRGGYQVTDPETQLRTALQSIQTRLQNQIKDLEFQIQSRTKIVKERREIVRDEKTKALEARRNELKAQFDEIFKPPLTDAQRLALWKDRTRNRIAEYEQRVRLGDFKPKPKPEPVRFDNEALHLRFNLHEIHRAWLEGRLKDHLAQQNALQKLGRWSGEVLNTMRALLTSFDLSAVLRQGGFIGFGHPIRSAKSFPAMFKAWASEEGQYRTMEEIRTRPNAPLYDQSKLYLAEHGQKLSSMEEVYMSRWAEKLPVGLGKGVKASQRAYTTFLNKLRADSFDAMAQSLVPNGKPTLEEAKIISNFINVATGRGSLSLDRAAAGLNTVFFAPKYVLSRFQLLTGQPFWTPGAGFKGTVKARAAIAKEYARFLAGAAVVYALGVAAGGTIETDRRSADFGKIRFGDTRIDPLAGLIQIMVLEGRLQSGQTKGPTGKVRKASGPEVAGRFIRTKLAPGPGLAMDVLPPHRDVVGQPVTPATFAARALVPITWQDIAQATNELGVPAGTALAMLSILGMGVQTYSPNKTP